MSLHPALDAIHYLQIEPQHSWHGPAVIRGNASALRELARALLAVAEKDAGTTDTLFASDGEGYEIEVRRVERPDDFPDPFYTCQIERRDYSAAGKEFCGQCGQEKKRRCIAP